MKWNTVREAEHLGFRLEGTPMELHKDELIFELRARGKEVGTDEKKSVLLALLLANIISVEIQIQL